MRLSSGQEEYERLYTNTESPDRPHLEVTGHNKTHYDRFAQATFSDFHPIHQKSRTGSQYADKRLSTIQTPERSSMYGGSRCQHARRLESGRSSINSKLSPLLGKYTAEEFHHLLIERVCEQCEKEKIKPHDTIKEYAWKKRDYLLTDLFDVHALKLPCQHSVKVHNLKYTKNEYLGRDNAQSKLEREKKLSERKTENSFLMMGGFMSAKG